MLAAARRLCLADELVTYEQLLAVLQEAYAIQACLWKGVKKIECSCRFVLFQETLKLHLGLGNAPDRYKGIKRQACRQGTEPAGICLKPHQSACPAGYPGRVEGHHFASL